MWKEMFIFGNSSPQCTSLLLYVQYFYSALKMLPPELSSASLPLLHSLKLFTSPTSSLTKFPLFKCKLRQQPKLGGKLTERNSSLTNKITESH